jgi:hypothetical protein
MNAVGWTYRKHPNLATDTSELLKVGRSSQDCELQLLVNNHSFTQNPSYPTRLPELDQNLQGGSDQDTAEIEQRKSWSAEIRSP